jgi:hypothetical protein
MVAAQNNLITRENWQALCAEDKKQLIAELSAVAGPLAGKLSANPSSWVVGAETRVRKSKPCRGSASRSAPLRLSARLSRRRSACTWRLWKAPLRCRCVRVQSQCHRWLHLGGINLWLRQPRRLRSPTQPLQQPPLQTAGSMLVHRHLDSPQDSAVVVLAAAAAAAEAPAVLQRRRA